MKNEQTIIEDYHKLSRLKAIEKLLHLHSNMTIRVSIPDFDCYVNLTGYEKDVIIDTLAELAGELRNDLDLSIPTGTVDAYGRQICHGMMVRIWYTNSDEPEIVEASNETFDKIRDAIRAEIVDG